MRIFKGFLCVLILFTLVECSSVPEKRDSNWIGYTDTGKASYYATKFQSKKTASGELYDRDKKTAAHKKLPFGTKVRVTNIKNRKSVIVKINDRGPFVKGRIVDLSSSAFSRIANLDAGVIEVKIKHRNRSVFVVHKNGEFFAYHNQCPHTGASLEWQEDQFLDLDKALIQCATHDALFTIDTGECIAGPCVGSLLQAIPLSIRDNNIHLEL